MQSTQVEIFVVIRRRIQEYIESRESWEFDC